MTNPTIIKLNEILAKKSYFESYCNDISEKPQRPVIFIVGLPRSGTTPLTQLMIQRFKVGYVSNLIARFWEAPEAGIALVRELSEDPGSFASDLKSNFGFTLGYEGHHEFGYFWKRWLNFKETHYLDYKSQCGVDVKGLNYKLSMMENAWERPLLFKNPAALPLQTEFFANSIPTALFVHINRKPIEVAASLLNGRRTYMGNINDWFSVKPQEYIFLKDKTVPEQIAGQIHYTQKHINQQLQSLPDHKKLHISFSDLCRDSNYELNRIRDFFFKNNSGIEERGGELPRLSLPSPIVIDDDMIKEIRICLDRLGS